MVYLGNDNYLPEMEKCMGIETSQTQGTADQVVRLYKIAEILLEDDEQFCGELGFKAQIEKMLGVSLDDLQKLKQRAENPVAQLSPADRELITQSWACLATLIQGILELSIS